jgi:hypothetical protein
MYNAEHLTSDAQTALRRSIEIFSTTTRFIMVVRNPEKLIAPILSRFCDIYVPLPTFSGVRMSFYKMYRLRNSITLGELAELRRADLIKTILDSKKKINDALMVGGDVGVSVGAGAGAGAGVGAGAGGEVAGVVETPVEVGTTKKIRKPRGRANKKTELIEKSSDEKSPELLMPAFNSCPPISSLITRIPLEKLTVDLSCLSIASKLYDSAYTASDIMDALDKVVECPEREIKIRLKYDIMRRHIYHERAHIAILLYYILMRTDIKIDNLW